LTNPRPRQPCLPLADPSAAWNCPQCGESMKIGCRLTAFEITFRCYSLDSS
jgi:hypothetical protein